MELLISLFKEYTGTDPVSVSPLTPAGSNRRYYRLKNSTHSLIGVEGTSPDENRAFIHLSGHFRAKNLPVPTVLSYTADYLYYLQEDMGDLLLFDVLTNARKTGEYAGSDLVLLEKTMRSLAQLQVIGAENLDFNICYPQPEFNMRSVMWDLNYFKYCFLKITGLEFQEDELENAFVRFADQLLRFASSTFMYRDFQSRNVMVLNDEISFIDFQGGRRGPLAYDVASFLWQAKAQYPVDLKNHLIEVYLDELMKIYPMDANDFRQQLKLFVLFRTLQVLGAYGFRGYIERKAHFLESVPFAIENLKDMLIDWPGEKDYLYDVLSDMVHLPRFKKIEPRDYLTIKVYSFSYKKGIPEDLTGNGGGFVFDCRAVHNPGKYDEYKKLTGMDQPVKDFLEKDGEILEFLKNAKALVEPSVERYIKRGFSDLMMSFGCTGGQHRSVYSAQKMAEYLAGKYGVKVELIHREQQKIQSFNL